MHYTFNMDSLIDTYVKLIEPILPLAQKAYGSRELKTPAHKASKEYTRLLVEFQAKGGSLPEMAKALEVNYSGIRRRVVMSGVSIASITRGKKSRLSNLPLAIERIKVAKESGDIEVFNDQVLYEYQNGYSLQQLAKGLGMKSASPLYYCVQRSIQMGPK